MRAVRTVTATRRSTLYPESVTPNLHALARSVRASRQFLRFRCGRRYREAVRDGRRRDALPATPCCGPATVASPIGDYGDDPEDYARGGLPLQRAWPAPGSPSAITAALLRLSGYDGEAYHLDVPALSALNGNVDLDYGKPAPRTSAKPNQKPDADAERAAEFQARYAAVRPGRPHAELYVRVASG